MKLMRYQCGYEVHEGNELDGDTFCGNEFKFEVQDAINNNGVVTCTCGTKVLACSICTQNGCGYGCSVDNSHFEYWDGITEK